MAEKKVKTVFMITPSLKEQAENLAKEQGISFGELIRRSILVYLGGDVTLEERIAVCEREIAEIKKRMEGTYDT